LQAVERLRPIAVGLGITMGQLALAWVLRQPGVSSAIIGASRPEQIDENVQAAEIVLEQSALQQIEAITGPVAFS
jgi:aryl-alcohol dehydrogenase-like predicted oxidoreductase